MQDENLTTLLRDWANEQLPDDDKREKILHNVESARAGGISPPVLDVFGGDSPAGLHPPLLRRRRIAAALSGIIAVAATLMFMVTLPPPKIDVPAITKNKTDDPIRISLIVLKKLPDSENAVEFLEDTIFDAEGKTLHELSLGEHKLFLWIYPLKETLYSLDIGIDKAAETGIVAVPERTQALQFTSNGDRFDVFVSVLPVT
jgi:hypothetical protein